MSRMAADGGNYRRQLHRAALQGRGFPPEDFYPMNLEPQGDIQNSRDACRHWRHVQVAAENKVNRLVRYCRPERGE